MISIAASVGLEHRHCRKAQQNEVAADIGYIFALFLTFTREIGLGV
jgi:hypothetical protein